MGNRSFAEPWRQEYRALTARESDVLQAQRELVGDMLREHCGVYSLPVLRSDLAVLQQIVDDSVLSPQQQDAWAAVGIVFGDLLAAELGLEWCAFSSAHGIEPAIQSDDFALTLFPQRIVRRLVEEDEVIQFDSLMDHLASHLHELHERHSRREPKRLVTAT